MYDANVMRTFHLYILGNDSATTLYIGAASAIVAYAVGALVGGL